MTTGVGTLQSPYASPNKGNTLSVQQKLTAAGRENYSNYLERNYERLDVLRDRLGSKRELSLALQTLTKSKPFVSYSGYPQVDVKGDTDVLRALAAQTQTHLESLGFRFKVESSTSTIGVSKRVAGFARLEAYINLVGPSQNGLSVSFNE